METKFSLRFNKYRQQPKLQSFNICLNRGVLKFALGRTHICGGCFEKKKKTKGGQKKTEQVKGIFWPKSRKDA